VTAPDRWSGKLDPAEFFLAGVVGVMRRCMNIRGGETVRRRSEIGMWDKDIIGAIGEMFACQKTGLRWLSVLQKGGMDTLPLEVRTTDYHYGSLILHPEDPDDRMFVLVTADTEFYSYCLRGGILGADGKHKRFWKDKANSGRPAYYVPQDALMPMDDVAAQYLSDWSFPDA